MSQSLWQIGRPDLNAFFFFFFFFFLSSRRVRFESVTALKYITWFWMNKIQDNTELKKSVVQSVSLCLSYLFLYILTSKFIKKLEKKIKQAKTNSNLEFCWMKRAPKNKCTRQLWDIGFIFFSLTFDFIVFSLPKCSVMSGIYPSNPDEIFIHC